MPIIDILETKQLEFGYGDINVASGLLKCDEVIGVVCFNEQVPRPIGTKGVYEPHQEVEAEETPIRMVFNKVESIDVVIRALEEAKKYMINGTV